jgi:hypothetical protein
MRVAEHTQAVVPKEVVIINVGKYLIDEISLTRRRQGLSAPGFIDSNRPSCEPWRCFWEYVLAYLQGNCRCDLSIKRVGRERC